MDDVSLLFHASDGPASPSNPLHMPSESRRLLATEKIVYYYEDGQVIQQTWHWLFIVMAYMVALIGALAAIRLLEHALWRSERERQNASCKLSPHVVSVTPFA